MAGVQVKLDIAEGAAVPVAPDAVLDHAPGHLELAAQVEPHLGGADRVRRDRQPLEHKVGPTQHDLAILEGAGLTFVGVQDHVVGLRQAG